jgi:hypothetical protein
LTYLIIFLINKLLMHALALEAEPAVEEEKVAAV